MCGFSGFFQPQGFIESDAVIILKKMAKSLIHRGPDAEGYWLNSSAGIGLVHRRLSILDISDAGNQPMTSNSGRYVIIFNGEIYNHLDLRNQIETHERINWRSHSDTETILACFDKWGVYSTLKMLIGMFAIAVWDTSERTLLLARDRMGEKPLYYGWQSNAFLFGSELKALKQHPSFKNIINRDVVPLYFQFGYVPSPWSIWEGVYKLKPGSLLRVSYTSERQTTELLEYWSLAEVAVNGQKKIFQGTKIQAVDELEQILRDSISSQQISDVPIGAFLSGGVDSTAVVAIMQSISKKPVKTFTIGFNEENFNEANYARAISKYLKTEHHEFYITPKQAQDFIPNIPLIFDEPLGDISVIPTSLLSMQAKRFVSVSLSGDGSDELFGGYNRYSIFNDYRFILSKIPNNLRKNIANYIGDLPIVNNLIGYRTISIFKQYLMSRSSLDLYDLIGNHWRISDCLTSDIDHKHSKNNNLSESLILNSPIDFAMLSDALTYLPDDVLVKLDRAGMSVSLETRAPFLDHRLVEWSWRLPQDLKTGGANKKWILRQMLYKYVPKKLVDRPKMGFGVPMGDWLRGPLRDWAAELLDPTVIQTQGILNSIAIQKKWTEHISGKNNWEYLIWDVLMFQSWLRANGF